MKTETVVTNGIQRSIDYKVWTQVNEVRIYAVRGDVTDTEELVTMGQELAMQLGVEKYRISL